MNNATDRTSERVSGYTNGSRVLTNQRGVILPMTGIALIAVLFVAAAGVGFGRLTLASTEGQNAADVAALTGAMAVFNGDNPWADARDALEMNSIDTSDARGTLHSLQVGFYDYDNRDFSVLAGVLTPNAVRAVVQTNVNNSLSAVFGNNTSEVTKVAYASFSGLRGGRPTLPIVIGECHFPDDCYNGACLPYLSQAPSPSDNSAWTAYFDKASKNKVEDYMPRTPNCADGGGKTEEIWIGDRINISNGQITPLLRVIDCLVDDGMTEFLVPIVNCDGNFNKDRDVVGFATIEVDDVIDKGSAHFKGIYLHAIMRADAVGALGGRSFGTGNISLVPVASEPSSGGILN